MSWIAGIDFDSSAVYTVLVDEDTGAYVDRHKADLLCGPGNAFERARRVRDLLPARSRWADDGIVAVGIEATFSKGYQVTAALCRVQGAILACLPRDVLVVPLAANHAAPAGWKALTVGRTNASKADVKTWARANGMPHGLEQDFYDSFAIARATRTLWLTRRRAA